MQNEDSKNEKDKDPNLNCEPGIGFSLRDKNIKAQEEKGLFDFLVIKNTGENTKENLDNMKLLTDLKNLISKQLPKMPKEYIVRLVFDKCHENMLIVKRPNNKVIGGTCYRPNLENKFVEIAFLAISSLEQVKGFGTRLMNKLKDHCKKEGIRYFLTYADNNAIGYFKKQGFHKNIKMSKEQYREYIKDYDGGTLMEAEIENKIDYSNLSEILKQQKDCIVKYNKKFLNVKRKYTYKQFEDELKKRNINLNINNNNNINIINNTEKNNDIEITKEIFDCLPGVKEAGWTYEEYLNQCLKEKEKEEENESFIKQCMNIINKLKNHEKSKAFRKPVKEDVPFYYQKIKEPMDLQTLEEKVKSGEIKNKIMFEKDLRKIFNNAREFNGKNTHYYLDADYLEELIEEDLKKLKDS